ncbi:MAG: hypothetical protein WD578_07330 [Bacteroidales bacterium]
MKYKNRKKKREAGIKFRGIAHRGSRETVVAGTDRLFRGIAHPGSRETVVLTDSRYRQVIPKDRPPGPQEAGFLADCQQAHSAGSTVQGER